MDAKFIYFSFRSTILVQRALMTSYTSFPSALPRQSRPRGPVAAGGTPQGTLSPTPAREDEVPGCLGAGGDLCWV